jgi:glycosyltransferase involved in cell wall biosynthesis
MKRGSNATEESLLPDQALRSEGTPYTTLTLLRQTAEASVQQCVPYRYDVTGFARAIVKLMDDPDLRKQMGEFGRKRIEQALSREQSAENLHRAYKSLLQGIC